MKQKTGDTTNEKDAALEKEHQAITDMFNELCGKLDSLSNFHFTPKQVWKEGMMDDDDGGY